MNPLPRLMVVWLLALALPLQGVAATVMKVCAPAHVQAGVPADADRHAAQTQGGSAGAGDVAPCHLEASPGAHSCSACAACCAATALPASPIALQGAVPHAEPAPSAASSYLSPDGPSLERPPNHARA